MMTDILISIASIPECFWFVWTGIGAAMLVYLIWVWR